MIFLFNLKTMYFRLFEWLKVVWLYYRRDVRFILIDGLLVLQYVLKSPHRISKDFLKKKKASNIYGFGETPLTTLAKITKEARIFSDDVFYELGCGSGRTCLWMRTFVKCKVVGIDYLPAFIHKAQNVKRWAGLQNIDFLLEDMLKADLSKASVIYLYGTCLDDITIENLIHRLCKLRAKIITVSFPLSDYSPLFKTYHTFKARFPWGKANIFVNQLYS